MGSQRVRCDCSDLAHTPGLSCGIFSCGMQDPVLLPGMKPDPLHWEHGVAATGPQGKLPEMSFALIHILFFYFLFFVKDPYYLNVGSSLPILNICHFQIFCLSSYVQFASQFFIFLFILKQSLLYLFCVLSHEGFVSEIIFLFSDVFHESSYEISEYLNHNLHVLSCLA